MKSSKNKQKFQLYVYRPGFNDLGNIHTFPTLVAMTKNQKILESRGFLTETMRDGKLFDPDKIKRNKEKRDLEKRSKLMDLLLGNSPIEQKLNFAIPQINIRTHIVTTGPCIGAQYPECLQQAHMFQNSYR